jgi:hypothetical protein
VGTRHYILVGVIGCSSSDNGRDEGWSGRTVFTRSEEWGGGYISKHWLNYRCSFGAGGAGQRRGRGDIDADGPDSQTNPDPQITMTHRHA